MQFSSSSGTAQKKKGDLTNYRAAKCALVPSRDIRGTSTLQASTFQMTKNIDHYGDEYYLVVVAERRWAGEEITHQGFAVAVELEHEAEINIYQRLRTRVRV
jgi:hypothetical protein